MKRFYRFTAILSLCFMLACGGLLSSIRTGWAASKPFIQSLVVSGVISQTKADAATRDVDEILDKGAVAEKCVSDITVSGKEKQVKKAGCYFQFAQDFRVILRRFNIGGQAALDRIALIGQSFIAALEGYFHSVTGPASLSTDALDAEKNLKKELETQLKKLKEATAQ